jgi:DNA-binding beta-propeller fold protein YncE
MSRTCRLATIVLACLIGGAGAGSRILAEHPRDRSINGIIWVANRGAHTVRAFDADTGAVVHTVSMAPNSQPGDLAFAKGKVYVAEEFGTPPAIAVVDAEMGIVVSRILLPAGSRPHHVHASVGGNLVAVGLFGTDRVAVIDTRDDTLLGPWDSNPATTTGRVHAGVFSKDGNTLYLASDASNDVIAMDPRTGGVFWRMPVPGAHELAVTHDGKRAFVSRRTANWLAIINLEDPTQPYQDVLPLSLPDTLALSANERLLTVGLRTSPAQVAIVDTRTFGPPQLVTLSGEAGTIAGHQWTSPSGRETFAAFEGGTNPGIAVIDHATGHHVVQRFAYPGRPHGIAHARD